MKRIYLVPSLTTIFYFADITEANATEVSVGIYPPVTRITAEAKTHVTTPMSILNNTDQILTISPKLLPFRASEKLDGSVMYLPTKDIPKDLSDFLDTVKILDNEQEVKSITTFPKQYKTINIQFVTPSTQKDYYFSVIFTPISKVNATNDTTINLQVSTASNILLSVGHSKENVLINQFKSKTIMLNGPVDFTLLAENVSNNYITVSGSIEIFDMFGNKAGQINLLPAIILGNSSRFMEASSSNNTDRMISWNEKFLMGTYTAEANLHYGDKKQITAEAHFFSIPLIVLLIGFIVFLFLLGVMAKVLRKINFME